jgi:protein-disulfide isomerase
LKRDIAELALLLLTLAGLSACSGLPQIGGSTEASGSTAASGLTVTGATLDKPAFNPFTQEGVGPPPGGRELIENPTLADVMLTGSLPERAMGRADAPVTIIKYASMTCPYCRKFQAETFPVLKREYIDTGKVRFIIREFPIGHQSGVATVALRCAPEEKYFQLYDKLMAQQPSWVSQEVRHDPIFKVVAQVGMTRAQFDACQQDKTLIEGLRWVKERGRKLGVIGTPNFFVNGKLVKTVIGMPEIRAMIDPIIAGRVAQGPPQR